MTRFTSFNRTATSNFNCDPEISKRIEKAPGVMRRLKSHTWKNSKLEVKTKISVYRTCVSSALLNGSKN